MSSPDSVWVKASVIATVVGTVLAYISLALTQHWPPFESHAASAVINGPSASPAYSTSSTQGPTVGEVRAALLEPSDLAGIDANLAAEDIQLPLPSSCPNDSANRTVEIARQYTDDTILVLDEVIDVVKSSSGAHRSFSIA